jgi:LysM repeat protein
MQPWYRKVGESLRADLLRQQVQRVRPNMRRGISAIMAVVVIVSAIAVSVIPSVTSAANTNVLVNGGFESGFSSQAGCGSVGNGWICFTNGGKVNYGFHDDQWAPTVAEGVHSQLIAMDTKGIDQGDNDRYAGIYQTVRVVNWEQYSLNLRGMIRSTRLDGDPNRYTVQVGWTSGPQPNWTAVNNWQDTGWYTYYERTAPGAMSSFEQAIKAESDYVTVYVRVWKKWGPPEEELNVNLDGITLTGPSPYYGGTTPAPYTGGGLPGYDPYQVANPANTQQYVDSTSTTSCYTGEMVYNGSFELGYNAVALGSVGRGWGYFTNGGKANFGFYDDRWSPVVANGVSSQLISINSKGVWPTDGDRFAGIYQHIGRLIPGQTYELSLNGMLRGDGPGTEDPYRFVAEWGFNGFGDTDWTKVSNWKGMDLGKIYPRSEPGDMGSYRATFVAPSNSVVLFIRSWKKWPISEQEFDFNVDAISLKGCGGSQPPPPPSGGCVYVVQPGDTLAGIAHKYNTTVYALASYNNIPNPNIIYVGQHIQIPNCGGAVYPPPPPPPPPPPGHVGQTCVVGPGDTLSGIAKYWGVNMWELARINGIQNPNLIYVGQILKIP